MRTEIYQWEIDVARIYIKEARERLKMNDMRIGVHPDSATKYNKNTKFKKYFRKRCMDYRLVYVHWEEERITSTIILPSVEERVCRLCKKRIRTVFDMSCGGDFNPRKTC